MAFTALFFLGLVAFTHGFALEKNQPRIVNGEDAKPGEVPYQVSLQTPYGFHFCGGSVLNENYVITAAHCVEGKSPSSIKVSAGTLNLNHIKSFHSVLKIVVHAKYNPRDSWRNDIALLKVDKPFVLNQQVASVLLPEPGFVVKDGDRAVVSGWGRLYEGGPTTNILQRVDIFIASQNYCVTMYNSIGMAVYGTQICAHDQSARKGSCHGDSGGPLTVNGKLVGLVSWANGCASSTYPTVYTRVSSHLNWIKENAV